MKLFGRTNGKIVVASIAHYDYVSADGLMMDGGQPHLNGGYYRYSQQGNSVVFEVPQDMAELYNDYNAGNPRKYGIWNLEDVKVLTPEEYPDTESFEWRAENEIWGTNGLEGNQPTTYVLLKDCSKEHLEKISELCDKRGNTELKQIADYWLTKK